MTNLHRVLVSLIEHVHTHEECDARADHLLVFNANLHIGRALAEVTSGTWLCREGVGQREVICIPLKDYIEVWSTEPRVCLSVLCSTIPKSDGGICIPLHHDYAVLRCIYPHVLISVLRSTAPRVDGGNACRHGGRGWGAEAGGPRA